MLAFPTRSRPELAEHVGHPFEASPCRCEYPLIDVGNDSCWRCGHWSADTIRKTFAERARVVALGHRKFRKSVAA